MVKDIAQGHNDSTPENFTEYNGKLYFSAFSLDGGTELWVTDGTTAGTKAVKDINPNGNSYPNYLTVYNDKLYFYADSNGTYSNKELWVTDGSEDGTVVFSTIEDLGVHDPADLIVYNGHLYFSGSHDLYGRELWKSDGTLQGTYVLKDINTTANYANSHPEHFYIYNGQLYFTAEDGSNGRELWVTDGTSAGTVKVEPDVSTGSNPLQHNPYFMEQNGSLYFTAGYDSNGYELWKLTTEVMNTNEVLEKLNSVIYPNPVINQLTIELDKVKSSRIQFFNLQGKLLMEEWVENKKSINLSTFPAGVYLLKIEATGETKKIIKR